MGRILLYRAWYVTVEGQPLPDDVKEFVLYSLRLDPHPSTFTVLRCLLIIDLFLGVDLDADDRQVTELSFFYLLLG